MSYLQRLCGELAGLLGLDSLAVDGSEALIPAKHVVPLGLITHELVTNAVKHGGSQITVSFHPDGEGGYLLRVADDGPGIAAGFELTSSSGLGMKLVQVLTQQIRGQLSSEPGRQNRGTRVTLAVGA